jgi:hypothetical protein
MKNENNEEEQKLIDIKNLYNIDCNKSTEYDELDLSLGAKRIIHQET